MAENNKVSVEITLEEKATLAALTKLTKEIGKTEASFNSMGKSGDKSFNKLSKSSKEAVKNLEMASIPFKRIEQQAAFSLKKAADSFSNLGNKASSSIGGVEQASNGIGNSFKSLVGGVTIANLASSAIIGTANAVKNFVVESINAAIEAEESINKLSQSLRATGSYSKEAVDDFSAFSVKMAETTKYSDDLILSQVAIAKSFGATNEEAKKLILAAANLSATFGGSLEDNVRKLGQTLNGDLGKLGKLVPELKSVSKESLVAGDAVNIVNSKFSGAASSEIDTYAGKLNQLKKAFGELQEAAGGTIVESGIADNFLKTGKLINLFNKYLSDSKVESARAAGGFVETSESIKQLERRYSELYTEAEKAKNIINNPSFFDTLLARPVAAAENLKRIREEMASIKSVTDPFDKMVKLRSSQGEFESSMGGNSGRKLEKTDEQINSEKEKYNKLIMLRKDYYAQLQLSEAEYEAYQNEKRLISTQITEENRAIELQRLNEFEMEKINASFLAEEQRVAAIADSQTREYAQAKIAYDKKLALEKKTADNVKQIDAQMAQAKAENYARVTAITGSAFQLAAALAKDGSKEQFLIQKGAALAEIALARGKAIALIPAQTAHIPFPKNLPAIASLTAFANAQAALGVATVAAQAIKGYEQGGIIPGNSLTGDRIPIMANSSEMILNRQQQTELFKIANGGSGSGESGLRESIDRLTNAIMSQPITISVDGRKIAESVRSQVQGGFRLA